MSNHLFCLCGEKGNQDAQSQVSDLGSVKKHPSSRCQQAQNSHPCEVWINDPVSTPEPLPVGSGRWHRAARALQRRGEGQDSFLYSTS